jgi:hypothetical protein
MQWKAIWKSILGHKKGKTLRKPSRYRPLVELLEDRVTPVRARLHTAWDWHRRSRSAIDQSVPPGIGERKE